MKIETLVHKGGHGTLLVSEIALGNNGLLVMKTMKRSSGKIVAVASYEKQENGFVTYTYGDYSKAIAQGDGKATMKNLMQVHTFMLGKASEIEADVRAWLAAKEAA